MYSQAYTESEEKILSQVRDVLKSSVDPSIGDAFTTMEENLLRLSEAFSHYPSILEERGTGAGEQSVWTLVETLFNGGTNHTVLLPTKVVVGRSFMIAKFNIFGFLRKLCDQFPTCSEFADELQSRWEEVIFSLLIEDVYQVIIESAQYPIDIRRQAALDLIYLWENRFDQNVTEYAPTLVVLWSVRRRIAPVFGTMLGTMELMRLSSLLTDRWHHFLERHADEEEVIYALEEFLFGLTYEDIIRVREDMAARGIHAINRDQLRDLPDMEMEPDELTGIDPREMYRFYQQRAKFAESRRLSHVPGPTRSLEELLLVHMIEEKLL